MNPNEDFEFSITSPFSSDADLSKIITNVTGQKAATRKRLANGPQTRAFLNAAVDLTAELFEADPDDKLAGDDDGLRPTMSYLSRRKVLERAKKIHPELLLSENMFRHRWNSHRDFVADFISYALAERHWSLGIALSEHSSTLLMSGDRFPEAIHRFAYEDLKLVLESASYRFQLLAIASAQSDSASSRALVSMYQNLSEVWIALYRKVLDHYGLSFRPGTSMDDFNIILQSTAEGLGMRLLSGTSEPIIDHNRKSSLLGTAAMALFLGLIDPGDGCTVEQAASFALDSLRRKEG